MHEREIAVARELEQMPIRIGTEPTKVAEQEDQAAGPRDSR